MSGSPYSVSGSVQALAIDPQQRFLAAATNTNSVAVFAINPSTGALTSVPGSPFAAAGAGSPVAASFNFDGCTLAIGTQGGQVDLYSVNGGTGSPTPGPPFTVAASLQNVSFASFGGLLS